MPDYDSTDRGALFKNDRKEKDTQPDYRGDINVNGVDYWISAWLKEGKTGTKFMSLSVQLKEDHGNSYEQAREKLQKKDTVHDVSDEPIDLNDIPF